MIRSPNKMSFVFLIKEWKIGSEVTSTGEEKCIQCFVERKKPRGRP
jgi:hypothetical protein